MNNEVNNNFELPAVGQTLGEGVYNAESVTTAAGLESLGSPLPSASSSLVSVNDNALDSASVSNVPFVNPSASGSSSGVGHMSADDADLIEKEWVLKAKNIIAATREDPRAQNIEINKFKAEYLKKRYGKDIKTEDS